MFWVISLILRKIPNFGENDKFWEKIFSWFFPVQQHIHTHAIHMSRQRSRMDRALHLTRGRPGFDSPLGYIPFQFFFSIKSHFSAFTCMKKSTDLKKNEFVRKNPSFGDKIAFWRKIQISTQMYVFETRMKWKKPSYLGRGLNSRTSNC